MHDSETREAQRAHADPLKRYVQQVGADGQPDDGDGLARDEDP